jgi:hypothetical protein
MTAGKQGAVRFCRQTWRKRHSCLIGKDRRVQVAQICVASCEGRSHPGLTDLLQLRRVVNLIFGSTRAMPISVSS